MKTTRRSPWLGRLFAASLALVASAGFGAAQVVVEATPAGVSVGVPAGIGASGIAAGRPMLLPSADFARDLSFQMDRIGAAPASAAAAQALPTRLQAALQAQVLAGVPQSQAVATQNILVQALSDPKVLASVQEHLRQTSIPGNAALGSDAAEKLRALAAAAHNENARAGLHRYAGELKGILSASLAGNDREFSRLFDGLASRTNASAAAAVDAGGNEAGAEKIRRPLQKSHAAVSGLPQDPLSAEAAGEREETAELVMAAAAAQRSAEADASRAPPAAAATHRSLTDGPLVKPELQPDFIDIGMGPTGMMAMLAAVVNGRTAVGVEIRGAPTRGVHQNIREEWLHVLALIDKKMRDRYGDAGVPKLPNGKPFILSDFFYNSERVGGALDFPEIYGKGDEQNQNVAGRLGTITFEDARDETLAENGGKSKLFVLPPPTLPDRADPTKVTGDMKKVLDSPSTFQAALINYELMLRNYLKAIERQDKAAGRAPRVKMYENHRVVQDNGVADGYVDAGGKKRRIIIEEVVDQRDDKGAAARVRKPGTNPIDLGVPTRFQLTPGFGGGADAKTLGYEQEDVVYTNPKTGAKIAATQNWIVGEVTANIGGQLLRRISTAVDPETGQAHTIRQIAVGHENAPNVGWVPVQVPDFMTFDPIKAGAVPAGTDPKSPEYTAASKKLILDYYISQVSAVTHIPESDIRKMRMFYGPNFFTLKERLGKTARVAANGNVGGDLMGNGHFLTSGGSMTGMIGQVNCWLDYWADLDAGMPPEEAAHKLEADIKVKTEAWLHVSAKEFDGLSPANFGEDRAKAIGIKADAALPAAPSHAPAFGLAGVLGQSSWMQSFMRLLRGEFGKAGVDFYVPEQQLDVTASPNVTVHRVALPAETNTTMQH